MEIIPLYDAPHLIKYIRNNLLDKDLEFDVGICEIGERKFATWKDIINLYEIDVYGLKNERFLPKLTDSHVCPAKIRKMKVKNAVQVFSLSVSSRLDALAGGRPRNTSLRIRVIPEEGKNTANITSFFNKLMDAFNGKVKKDESSAKRTILTDNSFHVSFFQEAIEKLGRLRYVSSTTKVPLKKQPPSLINLKDTLRGFIALWKKLKTLNFKSLKTKNINQDPLENFFSRIRNSSSNNKPTCFQFIGLFKTLVVSNFNKIHSDGANCIDDESNFVLSWQNYFGFKDGNDLCSSNNTQTLLTLKTHKPSITACNTDPVPEKSSVSNANGHIYKTFTKPLPSFNSCAFHQENINKIAFCVEDSSKDARSLLKEIHLDIKSILRRIVTRLFHVKNIVKITKTYLKNEINTNIFSCITHRNETIDVFLYICMQEYILSTTSFLISILNRKINYNLNENTSANILVIRACAKRDSSFKKRNTYSNIG